MKVERVAKPTKSEQSFDKPTMDSSEVNVIQAKVRKNPKAEESAAKRKIEEDSTTASKKVKTDV